MKFMRKYVGPIYTTPNRRQSASCRIFLRGRRWWTPLDRAGQTRFSRSARSARKASEICLRASEKTVGESLTGLCTVTLNTILSGTRNQQRLTSSSVIRSKRRSNSFVHVGEQHVTFYILKLKVKECNSGIKNYQITHFQNSNNITHYLKVDYTCNLK